MSERPKITQMSGSNSMVADIYLVAAGTARKEAVFINKTGATINITSASVVFGADITANTTDYFTIGLINSGLTGGGSTAITSTASFNLVGLAALVPKALTISTTAADLLVTAGQVVALSKTETASGMELPNGKLALQFQFV